MHSSAQRSLNLLPARAGPTYSAGGELTDGGEALDQGGLLGYYQDLTYICILVQVLSLATRRAWLAFLSVRPSGCSAVAPAGRISAEQVSRAWHIRADADCPGHQGQSCQAGCFGLAQLLWLAWTLAHLDSPRVRRPPGSLVCL